MCTKAFADCCRAGSSCFFAACQVLCPTPGFRFLSGACVSQPLVADAALLLRTTPSQLVAACRCACTCVCCRLLRALFLAAVEKSSLRSTLIACASAGALASGLTTLLGAFIAFRLASLPCLCSTFATDRSCQYTSVPPVCTQSYFWNLWRLPPQVTQLFVWCLRANHMCCRAMFCSSAAMTMRTHIRRCGLHWQAFLAVACDCDFTLFAALPEAGLQGCRWRRRSCGAVLLVGRQASPSRVLCIHARLAQLYDDVAATVSSPA